MKKYLSLFILILLTFTGCDDLTEKLEESIKESQGLTRHTLTVNAQQGGSITTPSLSSITVGEGDTFNLSAEADEGYTFSGWSASGEGAVAFDDGNERNTTATLSGGDAVVTAGFSLFDYIMTVESASGGTVSPSGDVPVEYGVPVTLAAAPDSNHSFQGWSKTGGEGDAVFADSSAPETTVTVTGGDVTITPSFQGLPRTITLESDEGCLGLKPDSSPFEIQDGVPFLIGCYQDFGYEFTGWSATGSGTVSFDDASNKTTEATVTGGDATIRAGFSILEYTLTINAVEGGTVTPSGSHTLDFKEEITITAAPDENHTFDRWKEVEGYANFGDIDYPSTTIYLTDKDTTIEPIFIIITRICNLTAGTGGSIVGDSVWWVDDGTTFTIKAACDTGYNFVEWTATGEGTVTFGDESSLETTAHITGGNAEITAKFE